MKSFFLSAVRSEYSGYIQINGLANSLKDLEFETIQIDLGRADRLDANLCSPLGAIFYKTARNLNNIELKNFLPQVETILNKNGFLNNYGHTPREDTFGSTIQYQRFEPTDDRLFNVYLDRQLEGKAIPDMTVTLRNKLLEGLMEIFNNAVIHSETKMGIFVCGQYYYKKQHLEFTITDLGIGIRQNIYQKIGLDLSAAEAIDWAMNGSNTTKRGPIPGGLGLKLLREFISLNQGKIQIISDLGYWEQKTDGHVDSRNLPFAFPGTIVNIEINTADQKSYMLSSEKIPDNIF